MSGIETILNPIGKIAPERGIGQALSPSKFTARKTGFIAFDPAKMLAPPEPLEFEPFQTVEEKEDVKARKKQVFSDERARDTVSSTLLGVSE